MLFHTFWFVIQCIARRVEGLPISELEIITFAYTTINVGIFIAWWDKPKDVDCSIRVLHSYCELHRVHVWDFDGMAGMGMFGGGVYQQ